MGQYGGVRHQHTLTYRTDGVGTTGVVAGGDQMTYKSHWKGESLVTVARNETAGGGFTETRSLTNEGKAQTVETVDPDSGTLKLVFDKR